MSLIHLEELQLRALTTAISKARETGKFQTPDYFLWLWLSEYERKNRFSNLYWEEKEQVFRLRIRTGSYIDPTIWRLKGKNRLRLNKYYHRFGTSEALGASSPSPKYLRARIAAIHRILRNLEKDAPERALLRNGVFPKNIDSEKMIQIELAQSSFSHAPLSFVELTSLNTWFALHPGKIAGREQITSSREFPITIKGTKDDIVRTIKAGLTSANHDFPFTLQLRKRAAKAKLKLLSL